LTKHWMYGSPPAFTTIAYDTGSTGDQITSNPNQILYGKADKGSAVTISRGGVGVIGTATADASTGVGSFNYTGTTLPARVTTFTAQSTLNGVTGPISAPYPVTIELTGPTVTLDMATATSAVKPMIRVTATDADILPNTTTVTLDVDTNNNGVFTDPVDFSTSGTLTNNTAAITLSTPLAVSST